MSNTRRDYSKLLIQMDEAYARYSPRSGRLQERASRVMVDGGSHTRRLNRPYPPRIERADGAWLIDADGHKILDFWQGHFANILGHNPKFLTMALANGFQSGLGLQTGFTDELQIEVAELLCKYTGAEKARLTTSGTLGTMYAIMLARVFTSRDLVMKIGGGFHGAQPWGMKGVSYKSQQSGYNHAEGEGVPGEMIQNILLTPYNDPQALEENFLKYGERVSCLIMEPVLGAGGFIASSVEFMQTARQLTHRYGAFLILDEVISGFRFRAGDLGRLYGIEPDLAIFGKVIGGGMPIAAVAGRNDVMNLVGKAGGNRVQFSGGTYSGHPATMLAAKTMMEHLAVHENQIYPQLAAAGHAFRETLQEVFDSTGIPAVISGEIPQNLCGSSLGAAHFPLQAGDKALYPEKTSNPEHFDVMLRTEALPLALILEDVHIITTHGAVTIKHGDEEQSFFRDRLHRAVDRIKGHR